MIKYLLAFFAITFLFLQFYFPANPQLVAVPQTFTVSGITITPLPTPPPGTLIEDPNVTFVGKAAARSADFLNWSLHNYSWIVITTPADPQNNSNFNPLLPYWITVEHMSYGLLPLLLIVAAFVLITTRGGSITAKKFIGRLIFVIVFVTFSFAIVQFLYQVTDAAQGFFLSNPPPVPAVLATPCAGEMLPNDIPVISDKNLVNMGFCYKSFVGYSAYGHTNDESAFMTLLLVKLTSITYYLMGGLLIVRKIILWFFIILSPLFPFLLVFAPVRNTAKLWAGEFFKWLLYAPLFAVFLYILVHILSSAIPLGFTTLTKADFDSLTPADQAANSTTAVIGAGVSYNPCPVFGSPPQPNPTCDHSYVYPTAINILLGAPGVPEIDVRNPIDINNPNDLPNQSSLNFPQTFVMYLITLIMMWVVILLPFALLQIFLNYVKNYKVEENSVVQKILGLNNTFFKPLRPTPPSPVTTGSSPHSAISGLARAIPAVNRFNWLDKRPTTAATPQTVEERLRVQEKHVGEALSTSASTFTSLQQNRTNLIARPSSTPATNFTQVQRSNTNINSRTQVSPTSFRIRSQTQNIQRNAGFAPLRETLSAQQMGILNMTTLGIPTVQDITNYDISSYITSNTKSVAKDTASTNTSETTNKNTSTNNTVQNRNAQTLKEIARAKEVLSNIAHPISASSFSEQARYARIKETLQKEAQKGDPLSNSIFQAAATNTSSDVTNSTHQVQNENFVNSAVSNIIQQIKSLRSVLQKVARPSTITNTVEKQKYQEFHDILMDPTKITSFTAVIKDILRDIIQNPRALTQQVAQRISSEMQTAQINGDPLAQSLSGLVKEETRKTFEAQNSIKQQNGESEALIDQPTAFPNDNRLQQVSIDDYEAVKDMWIDNYKHLEVPQKIEEKQKDRKQWVKEDIQHITRTIGLFLSNDPEQVQEGMKQVSAILPFLLLGGFSQTEVVAYLKAKLEAGKIVQADLDSKQNEKGTLLEVKSKENDQKDKEQTTSAEEPVEEENNLAALEKSEERSVPFADKA